jgi:hypothetical protein
MRTEPTAIIYLLHDTTTEGSTHPSAFAMTVSLFTRRLNLVASRTSLGSTFFRGLSTQSSKNKKPEHPEEPHGPLMAGYVEFLDEMIEKASRMEGSMSALRDTYAKKKVLSASVKWMDPVEIEALFDTAGRQKAEIEATLAELKIMMQAAKKSYGVDAPDGEPDGHIQEEMIEVEHIIEQEAAGHKGKASAS